MVGLKLTNRPFVILLLVLVSLFQLIQLFISIIILLFKFLKITNSFLSLSLEGIDIIVLLYN